MLVRPDTQSEQPSSRTIRRGELYELASPYWPVLSWVYLMLGLYYQFDNGAPLTHLLAGLLIRFLHASAISAHVYLTDRYHNFDLECALRSRVYGNCELEERELQKRDWFFVAAPLVSWQAVTIFTFDITPTSSPATYVLLWINGSLLAYLGITLSGREHNQWPMFVAVMSVLTVLMGISTVFLVQSVWYTVMNCFFLVSMLCHVFEKPTLRASEYNYHDVSHAIALAGHVFGFVVDVVNQSYGYQ